MSRFTKNIICTEIATGIEIINGKVQIRRVGGLLPALKLEKRIWEMIALILGVRPDDVVKENYYLSFFDSIPAHFLSKNKGVPLMRRKYRYKNLTINIEIKLNENTGLYYAECMLVVGENGPPFGPIFERHLNKDPEVAEYESLTGALIGIQPYIANYIDVNFKTID